MNEKKVRVTLTIHPALLDRLRQFVKRNYFGLSGYVCRAVEDKLNQDEGKEKND